ncbi:MAG: hypothetical protein JO080_06780 [Mucilaginibacter sp.]|nr:hypothetical protein [Mucilaginibacter sp.]
MRDPNQPPTVFKRRHFGNPASFNIIITNYIVVAGGLAIFTSHHHIHWFFWVIFGLLAAYNVFSLYKKWEEYDKLSLTAYIIGAAGLPLLFLMF